MAPRRYDSPVRDAQSATTRARILDAALALLGKEGLDAVTIPAVAKAARVSVPTVYRHFPTLDDLMRGFLDWIRPRVGQTFERLAGPAPELPRIAGENYKSYESHAALLLPMMESRAFNRVRLGQAGRRAPMGAQALRPLAPRWSDRDLEGAAGAIYAFIPPTAWRWLRETWGLDPETAARASMWAMRVLLEAIAEGRGLDDVPAPSAAPRRKKKGARS